MRLQRLRRIRSRRRDESVLKGRNCSNGRTVIEDCEMATYRPVCCVGVRLVAEADGINGHEDDRHERDGIKCICKRSA